MLNPFPDLLMLGFFAPTLVRVAAAGVLLYAAYVHWQGRRDKFLAGAAVAHALLAAMLFFGYYTQIAALAGLLGTAASLILPRYFPSKPIDRTTAFLLLAIFASLLFSGAGAFAFDLPL